MTSESKAEPAKNPSANLNSAEHAALAKTWDSLISAGVKHRKKFQDAYEMAVKFCYGDHDFVYDDIDDVTCKATVPKVWEMVNIFGPMLNFRNPRRNAKVRFSRGPEDERVPFTMVTKGLLNYAVDELGLVREMRDVVDESVLGCGVMWLEKDDKSGLYGHYHGSPLDLSIDPDATTMEDAWWIARRRMMPRWEFAGRIANVALDHEDLPVAARSSVTELIATKGSTDDDGERRTGMTNDLLAVWEVWSKMGLGWKLKDIPEDFRKHEETMGDFVHFYVIPTSRRIWVPSEWPVPLWADNSWPCELLFFRKKSDYVWPVPLILPSLPLQKAVDWVVTFVIQHLKTSSRDFIAGPKSLEDHLKEKLLTGADMTYLDVNDAMLSDVGGDIHKIVSFLQHPPVNSDLWRLVDMALKMFEDSTGLYQALYAKSGGAEARTATADRSRQARADLRPDDMRQVVERFHTVIARKEAIAARLDYSPEFVASIMGQESGQIWSQYKEGDLDRVMREIDYTIDTGSAAKQDPETERDNSMECFDRLMQVALQMQDIEAVNRLTVQLQRGMNVAEEDYVMFKPPPPQPDPEQQKIEMEAKKAEQGMQLDAAKAQQDAQIDMGKAQLDADIRMQEAQIDLALQERKARGEMEMQGMEMEAAAAGHAQKLRQGEEMHEAKVAQARKAKPNGKSK